MVEDAARHRIRMEHEVAAHQSAAIGEPVGKSGRARVQQEPRRADAVGGEHHGPRLLRPLAPVAIVVDGAVGQPVRPERDLADPRSRDQARAGGERLRPVRDVRAGLGSDRAAEIARATVHAGAPAVVVARENGAVRGPPVPAEPLEAARDGGAERVERDRGRLARRLGRIGRIAGHARPPPSCDRSGRSTARASRSRSASRRRRRRGSSRESPRAGIAGSARSSESCCRPRRCTSAGRSPRPGRSPGSPEGAGARSARRSSPCGGEAPSRPASAGTRARRPSRPAPGRRPGCRRRRASRPRRRRTRRLRSRGRRWDRRRPSGGAARPVTWCGSRPAAAPRWACGA